jgi:hypothetical protein
MKGNMIYLKVVIKKERSALIIEAISQKLGLEKLV